MKTDITKKICLIIILSSIMCLPLHAEEKTAPDKQITELKKELDKMTKAAEEASKRLDSFKEENNKLRTERARMYEEAGTAYTKAGLLDEAIGAYTESLKCDPNNAQVHYYLGLLYQKSRKDVKKAVLHFKRYLYLNPDAKNKEEVRYIIEMIQNKR